MKYNVPADKLIVDFNRFSRGENFHADKNRLLVCATPKSGSTFLHKILTSLPNYNNCNLVPGEGARERELCIRKLVMSHQGFDHYASHLHLRYSHVTDKLIKQFDLKPIVLTRNIFDSVISIHDFYFTMDKYGKEADYSIEFMAPNVYIPSDITQWDKQRILSFIIDMSLPWHFNFLLTWQQYNGAYWLKYEDLIASPAAVLADINQFYNLGHNEQELTNALDAAQNRPQETNKNIGISGRGDELSQELRDKIYNQANYYKNFDLSMLGL